MNVTLVRCYDAMRLAIESNQDETGRDEIVVITFQPRATSYLENRKRQVPARNPLQRIIVYAKSL